ncbi:MAG TPA: TonB family protein [Thermoanaerobaculia bacterium]
MVAKQKPYDQFGPYILFKKLESDALGDLWRAAKIDGTSLGPTVALRRLTGGNREAILSSIRTAGQVVPLLTGPSFVRSQVIDAVSGVPFVAHEHAAGRSLRTIIDRARGGGAGQANPIPMDLAILIIEKIALSLATISELRFAGEKLSHGALLPQFVWITDDGEIRVAGQQLGKGMTASIKDAKFGRDVAHYFSPEYQHSGQPTKASEVYSLGAMLYLVVTGHEPPDATTTSAFAAGIRAAKTMAGTPVPDDIRAILDKSLNLDPAVRFPSAGEMKQALTALANSGKYPATTFNLAFYLSNLLKKDIEAETLERDKEAKVGVAAYLEAPASPERVAAPVVAQSPLSMLAAKPKSRVPVAVAATLTLVLAGGGAFFFIGSKKQSTAAAQPAKLASALPVAPPKLVITEPIVSSPAQQMPATAATTATVDPAAQKKAFEHAVTQRLHEEMMKLQADYTKQLQQKQSRNAPVQSAAADTPARTPERQTPTEPSAAQLDAQHQRDTVKPQDLVAQQPAPATQTVAPVQQQPAPPAAPQIHEGDVVEVTELDVAPKRTRDPHVIYPPIAARQRIETNVLASVLVSENGDVVDVKVLRGDDRYGFTDAAVRALRAARYTPAMKDGKRVKTWLPQIIAFKP